MVTVIIDTVVLGLGLAVLLTALARRLGFGLTTTEGLRDLLDGWWYGSLGMPRTPGSVIGQLRRQAAQLHLALTPGRVYGPARVHVEVHPDEHALLEPLMRAAADAVARSVAVAARHHGRRMPSALPVVELIASPSVRRGRPLISGSYRAGGEHPAGSERPVTPVDRAGDRRRTRRLDGGAPRATTVVLPPRRPSGTAVWLSVLGGGHAELGDALPSVIVGRDAAADLRVSASGVSRQHVRITAHPDGALVEDLDSTNGTYVDGLRLTGPHVVTLPVAVRLGVAGVEVRVTDPAATRTASAGANR